MDYSKNKFFNIGLILIFASSGVTILGGNYSSTIVAGIIALVGFVTMLYGIRQVVRER